MLPIKIQIHLCNVCQHIWVTTSIIRTTAKCPRCHSDTDWPGVVFMLNLMWDGQRRDLTNVKELRIKRSKYGEVRIELGEYKFSCPTTTENHDDVLRAVHKILGDRDLPLVVSIEREPK